MRPQTLSSNRQHQRLLGAAAVWLSTGSFLLITTLIPAYTQQLGWSPAFWLAVAPLVILLTLEPSLPRQLLALRRPRQQTVNAVMWH